MVEGPRFSLSPSLNRGWEGVGTGHVGSIEGRGGTRRIYWTCLKEESRLVVACHEASSLRESQLNRSTVPKDSEPSGFYWPLSFPSRPRHRPSWPLIHLSRFLFRELKSDILSRDTIRHASRLMSSRPMHERGFRTLERTGWDNCPYFREIDRRPGKKGRSPRRIRRKAPCSLSRAERRSREKKKKKG